MDLNELRDGETSMQEEAEFLAALVRAIKPEVCVETGTHKGYASIHIGNALKENRKGKLWTYDITDYGQKKNVEDAGLSEYVTTVIGDSADLYLDDPVDFVPVDFAFIDANHDPKFIVKEVQNLLPKLAPNAIIVFHDYKYDMGGPFGAIQELGLKVTRIPTHYGLAIYCHE